MKLPKIQEDEYPLKNTYFASITEKPLKKYKTDKLVFDWQTAQVQLIARIPDEEEILQSLIQLQTTCKKLEIPHFYTYFFVDSLLARLENQGGVGTGRPETKSAIIQRVKEQTEELKAKKSRWNKIVQLIQLRQNLVAKINLQVANNKLQDVYTHLDDIRFVNFEIVKKIGEWSEANTSQSEIHPFFLYEGNNYLIRMINDNANVINVLNSKAVKFLSPPNPFYLSRDGNKASMSQTQQTEIDNSMQILAKAKAQQLRMIINPPKFVTEAKNQTGQLKKLKHQLQSEKVERIKNAYKTSSFNSPSISMRSSIYESSEKNKEKTQKVNQFNSSSKLVKSSGQKLKISNFPEQGLEKRNRLEKMIQQKEIAVVSDLKNSQARLNKINKSSKDKAPSDNKGVNKYLSKVELLRKSVQQNNKFNAMGKLEPITSEGENAQSKGQSLMRLSTMSKKNKLPQSVAEIKAPKPKIRLVMEKQSFVEDVIKNFLPPQNIQLYKSLNVRKSASSFFKPSEKLKAEEKLQENNIDIKPVTQYSRTLSASQLTQKQFLKEHTKTKNIFSNSMTKKQNKSKSRSISEKSDLSLSKSPSKRFSVNPPSNERVRNQEANNNQEGLRIVNSKLRELTIMSIYGKKSQANPSLHNPYDNSSSKIGRPQNKKKEAKEEEKNEIDSQLREVKTRLKELSIKKIYDRSLSTKGFDTKKQKKQETLLKQKEVAMKTQNKLTEQELMKKQSQKEKLLQNLRKKDQRIEQLVTQLKKQEKLETNNNLAEQQQKLKEEKTRKLKQIEALKQKIRSENKLIKQQMQQQEKKFIELKEKQFQMKEEVMLKKHEMDMQQIKEQYNRKNKELEAKIMEEQKIRKQQEIKILKEQREMEELKMQMQEKKLKQQLLQQILKEHRQKQLQEEKLILESEELKKQRLKRQILEKQEIERKILENFEEDNRKLMEMFEAMKRKNEEAQKQNQKKLKEIKRMEQEAKKEQQDLKKLEAQLLEAQQLLQAQQTGNQSEVELAVSQNETIEDIEAVKLRVKQQILQEMMIKRREQENEQLLEKEQRAKKLAEIEEEIRNELKRQEQQMEKIEKEQRLKYQKIKSQLQQQHRKRMEQLEGEIKQENINTQKNDKEEDEKNIDKNFQQDKMNKQQYEKELKKISELQKQSVQQKESQIARNEVQNVKIDQMQKQQMGNNLKNQLIPKEKSEQKSPEEQKQNIEDNKVPELKNEAKELNEKMGEESIKNQVNKLEDAVNSSKLQHESARVQTSGKKDTQTVKQPTDQILTKYQNLQQHLSKCRQIYIDDKAFPEFLNNFFGQLAPEVKQMIPYTSAEILKFATSLQKKIDVFEGPSGQSVGWIESQKYILLGQISCVQNIVRKYGQVQIEMTYIFNKTNPYQKQFLAKQVKIFDKVGFIFQKKLKEDNIFSIKLIIKVPSQILPKGFKAPDNLLRIKSKIAIELLNSSQQTQQNQKYSYSYLLGQTLKNCLGSQEELQFKNDKSQQARIIQSKMHYKVYNDSVFKSEEIDDKKLQWEAHLSLRYIQTHDYCCYFMKGYQYSNSSSGELEKIYVIGINSSLSIVTFGYDKSCEGFSMDVLVSVKTNKLEKQRELVVCLPVWKKQEDIRLNGPGPKQFHFSYAAEANLAYGSIINTSVFKDEYKLMEAPFVFCLFETNESGVLLRQLSGEVVEQKDLVVNKR